MATRSTRSNRGRNGSGERAGAAKPDVGAGVAVRPTATEPTRLVVGIGASAGGLDAFKAFLSRMPPDSGMVFVLVQHLDPNHESAVPAIVGSYTAMRVQVA